LRQKLCVHLDPRWLEAVARVLALLLFIALRFPRLLMGLLRGVCHSFLQGCRQESCISIMRHKGW